MISLFSCQRKPQYGEGIVQLANLVSLSHQSEVLINFKEVIGHEVFSPKCLHNQPKSHVHLYLFLLYVLCFICFINQWMKRSKHGLFVFRPKNPNMEKALFNWPIVLQYDVKAKYQLISGKFSGMKVLISPERFLNQPKAIPVCICSINQSIRSISFRLLSLFCSRVFISRLYENRSKKTVNTRYTCYLTLFADIVLK